MPDDFSDPFRYGLSNLPSEPPDSFNRFYPQGQPPSAEMPPFGAPQVVQAGFALPRPRQITPGVLTPPLGAGPPLRAPQIPELWKMLGTAAALLPSLYGVGDRRGRQGADDDTQFGPIPPLQAPEIPEWWNTSMATPRQKGARKPTRARSKANDEVCYALFEKEQDECHRRMREGEYAHPDFYAGCLENARLRLQDCIANRGTPSKLPVWGDGHEEIWINTDR